MTPEIKTTGEKKLVGMKLAMSFANYKSAELREIFMPRRKEIKNVLTNELISLIVYKPTHFLDFKPTNEFVRWAVVEVSDFENIPAEMETFFLQGRFYAVFQYKGSNTDNSIYPYIYGTWLPASDFVLDDQPHFEVLGETYKNNNPASEEEIWIPVRPKNAGN